MKQKLTAFLFGIFSLTALAQDSEVEVKVFPKEIQTPEAYLDSIKKTFVNHKVGQNIDKKWIGELLNDQIFENMESDINKVYLDEDVAYNLPTETLKARLEQLNKKYPFDFKYSVTLERVIKNFLKNRSKSFERLMALSEYYFPMFEENLAKRNVPLEIKYLAIVESALNPKAKSRVGATGLWQFMYATGKQYGLEVNSYVDERSDPLKSTDAASKYLADLYDVFGNWEMVLASYNSGPGTVTKAIRRSGGKTNYWEIRNYLPKETQGYVPAFLATVYIYEYHKEHGIVPKKATLPYIKTDTIHLKSAISFNEISQMLDISVDEIKLLNPKYKLDFIPNYDEQRHTLRLPIDKIARFTSNEKKIYAYLDYQKNYKQQMNIIEEAIVEEKTAIVSNAAKPKTTKTSNVHVVKKGDTLSSIAKKYGNVTVAQLMKKNNIKNASSLKPGMKIKI